MAQIPKLQQLFGQNWLYSKPLGSQSGVVEDECLSKSVISLQSIQLYKTISTAYNSFPCLVAMPILSKITSILEKTFTL